jgi:hypothetical protein
MVSETPKYELPRLRFLPSKFERKMASIREPRNTPEEDLFLRVLDVFSVFRGYFCPIGFWPSLPF